MSITEKLNGVKSNLFDTLSLANETTGENDSNLGDAVARLADGYGKGGVTDVQVDGASVVTDGVASIPVSKGDYSTGLIRLRRNFGVSYSETHGYYINPASDSAINNRDQAQVLKANNIDFLLRKGMCDGKGAAWTPEEQARAQERIGIYPMSEEGY